MQNALAVECTAAMQWADKISERWRQSVEAVIATGRLLIEAKAALEHGQFGLMCDEMLPFTQSTAQRLMAIARDERLSRPDVLAALPPSWGTLALLTRLSDEQLAQALESKVIRPDTERWEIEALGRLTPPANANEPYWVPLFASPDLRRWTIAQLKLYAQKLQALVDRAGAASSTSTVGEVISDKALKKIWER